MKLKESLSAVKKQPFSTRDKVERGWCAEGVTAETEGRGNVWKSDDPTCVESPND